jgi:hypothetical protein
MALHGMAAAFDGPSKGCRRIMGCRDLRMLNPALDERLRDRRLARQAAAGLRS